MHPLGVAVLISISTVQQAAQLTVHLVGNAGVILTDGATSLLVDLPYEPGAFGYMRYDPGALRAQGTVVSVITHHHRDHFDAALFRARPDWQIIGPPSVTAGLPNARVLSGDSVRVGAFDIVAVRTPHTEDHRSYRVRWHGRVIYVVGDTEDPAALRSERSIDLLFITPWLSCTLADAGHEVSAGRVVAYHRRPDGSDRLCGGAEPLPQGVRFTLAPDT